MKGSITVNINNATLREALQDYFDKQLAEDRRMTVSDVKNDGNSYASLGVVVTLVEPEVTSLITVATSQVTMPGR